MPLSEFELIKKLTRDQSYFDKQGIIGPGDDCSVFDGNNLITTDTLIEDVHFSLDYSSFYEVGWKSIAVSLSDIAAMGGQPLVCTVALTVKEGLSDQSLEELYRGIYDISDENGLSIVGGDTTKSGFFSITCTIVGKSISEPILRSNAKSGDCIWLSNKIGLAQLGLDSFRQKNGYNECRVHHTKPHPRLELSKFLAKNNLASSMIDVSDGLFQDLMHIANSSNLSVKLSLESIPSVISYESNKKRFLELCTSGDDYELLFTSAKENTNDLSKRSDLTKIGSIEQRSKKSAIYVDGQEIGELLSQVGIDSLGYKHF